MQCEPIRRYLRRLDHNPPVFHADEVRTGFGSALGPFVATGLLREIPASRFAVCLECGGRHVCGVRFLADANGTVHRFISCPECGVQKLTAEHVRRWTADLTRFLPHCCAAGTIVGPIAPVVPDWLWRLGKATWAGRSREVLFARPVDPADGHAVVAHMSRHPKAVLLVATETTRRVWGGSWPGVVVALESVLSHGAGGIQFDIGHVESMLADAGLVGNTKPKRPRRKRADRAGNVDRLETEMIRHLQAAKDHAKSTEARTGTPRLLKPLSQEDLANLTGMSETTVSRCIRNQQPQYLKAMMRVSRDLDLLLSWVSPRRTTSDDD